MRFKLDKKLNIMDTSGTGMLFLGVVLFILFFPIFKGKGGNPVYYQNRENRDSLLGSPFETSGSTSRYALIEAMAENGTFFLNQSLAKFAAPDVTEYNGRFISIFTPGVSFIALPFYLLGSKFGISQIGVYSSTVLIAVLCAIAVIKIALTLGAGKYSAIVSGVLFIFGTNALSYSLTITQHLASTLVILLAIINTFKERTLRTNIVFGAIFGAGMLIDLPNTLILLPAVFYILSKHISVKQLKTKATISIKTVLLGLILGLLPFVLGFMAYNYATTGSPSTVAQIIGRSDYFKEKQEIELDENDARQKLVNLPFNTRNQLEGFYVLVISSQRSIFFYSTVISFGIVGLYLLYKDKDKRNIMVLFTAVVLTNLVVYTLFGDASGSWAFGPRYLIPATAILTSAIGVSIDRYHKNAFYIVVFTGIVAYSVLINVIGAMTTTLIPPKAEAVTLPDPIPYTFEYNFQLVNSGMNSSLLYDVIFSKFLTSWQYVVIYTLIILLLIYTIFVKALKHSKEAK